MGSKPEELRERTKPFALRTVRPFRELPHTEEARVIRRRRFELGLLLVLIAQTASCLPWLRVRITEGNPPSFTVRGTFTTLFQRRVDRLSVAVAQAPKGVHLDGDVLWQIEAIDGTHFIEGLHYGEVPAGFVQVVPLAGQPPRPLEPGWLYAVQVSGAGRGVEEFDYRGAPVTAEMMSRLLESVTQAPHESISTPGPLPPEKLRVE